MTDEEIEKFIEKAKILTKEITSSKTKARKFLYEAGICTKKGKLRKIYQQE